MSDFLVKRLREGDEFERFMLAERAADRIEELEAKLAKAVEECARIAESHQMYVDANEARIDAEAKLSESEALLAQAVGALEEAWFMLTVPLVNYEPEPEEPGLRRIKSTLAELKGQDDE